MTTTSVMKIKFNKKDILKISGKILDKSIRIKKNKAMVLALSGELGAGKTTLTKEIGKLLEIKNIIISPTFVIMKIYQIGLDSKYYSHYKKLIHIDAYRLDDPFELLKFGWSELVNDKDNLIILEWPERVMGSIDKETFWVKLKHIDDENRLLEF